MPVPVVIDAGRGERRWLLRCACRVALTLESLRALRQVQGLQRLRLDVHLPAAPQRNGWNGRRAQATAGRAGNDRPAAANDGMVTASGPGTGPVGP